MHSGSWDVIVVGGGLGGLVAATRAARRGARVVLMEKGELGGRALTHEKGGYRLNLGPHALYKAGAASRELAEMGIQIRGGTPDVSGFVLRGAESHPIPSGFFSLVATDLFGVGAKIEAGRIFAGLETTDTAKLREVSVGAWLGGITHPEVRQLFAAYLRLSTYCDDPRQSAGEAMAQLRRARSGVLYLDGGWQVLIDQGTAAATEAGVTIHTESRVAGVQIDASGAAMGVALANGNSHRAPAVIVVAGPQVAASLAPNSATLARWAEAAIPIEAACLDVGLTSLPKPRVRFALGLDRPLYYSVHSAVADLAPAGGAVIHVARYLSSGDPSSPNDRAELKAVLDRLQPGWRDVIATERFLPRMTVSHAVVTAAQGGLRGRPGPLVPDVPGLLVAGDWVGGEGMLADASVASAVEAADLAILAQRREGMESRMGVAALSNGGVA